MSNVRAEILEVLGSPPPQTGKGLHNLRSRVRIPRISGDTVECSQLNSLFVLFGIESWKPILTALILPPVPLIAMMLIGARLMLPRRGLGWLVIVLSLALLWLSNCTATSRLLTQFVLRPPAALSATRVAELKADVRARQHIAIVVLGGGSEAMAPEYGMSSLSQDSMERLRYGIWLSRETGLSIAFSGGIGWAESHNSTSEAQIAARIASRDFGYPIKWLEDQSRDTRENALGTVPLLRRSGVDQIVLVTHGWHMPRSISAFVQAAGPEIHIEPAPVGLNSRSSFSALDWLPTSNGFVQVRMVLRELVGRAVGA